MVGMPTPWVTISGEQPVPPTMPSMLMASAPASMQAATSAYGREGPSLNRIGTLVVGDIPQESHHVLHIIQRLHVIIAARAECIRADRHAAHAWRHPR